MEDVRSYSTGIGVETAGKYGMEFETGFGSTLNGWYKLAYKFGAEAAITSRV